MIDFDPRADRILARVMMLEQQLPAGLLAIHAP